MIVAHHPRCLNPRNTCDRACDHIDEEADLYDQADTDRDWAEPGAVPSDYDPAGAAA